MSLKIPNFPLFVLPWHATLSQCLILLSFTFFLPFHTGEWSQYITHGRKVVWHWCNLPSRAILYFILRKVLTVFPRLGHEFAPLTLRLPIKQMTSSWIFPICSMYMLLTDFIHLSVLLVKKLTIAYIQILVKTNLSSSL
jgi:hypothetical protein